MALIQYITGTMIIFKQVLYLVASSSFFYKSATFLAIRLYTCVFYTNITFMCIYILHCRQNWDRSAVCIGQLEGAVYTLETNRKPTKSKAV